jgi:CheY-like chemotaxis protein
MSVGNELVMIVDDDPDALEALHHVFSQFGYETLLAVNGKDALQRLRSSRARLPRLVVLDLWMPEMDGWQFRAAQQADPMLRSIPVVVVTADMTAATTAKSMGTAAFVSKPLDLGKLMKVVRELCDAPKADAVGS